MGAYGQKMAWCKALKWAQLTVIDAQTICHAYKQRQIKLIIVKVKHWMFQIFHTNITYIYSEGAVPQICWRNIYHRQQQIGIHHNPSSQHRIRQLIFSQWFNPITRTFTPGQDCWCHRLKRPQQPNLLTAFLLLVNDHTMLLSPL